MNIFKFTLTKTVKNEICFFSISIILMILIVVFGQSHKSQFVSSDRSTLTYVAGTVATVESESIDVDKTNTKIGNQTITVKINQGIHKGESLSIKNVVTYEHNVYVKTGNKVIVCIDQPSTDYFVATLFNYNRTFPIIWLVLIMLISLILVAGIKGIRSAFALIFTFVTLIFLLIPLISIGVNPVVASIITVVPIIIISMLSITGLTTLSVITIISTSIGVILAASIFYIVGQVFHINGYSLDTVDQLIPIAQTTHFKIKDLLFVAVLISSLGAMMDICISIVSSMNEVYQNNNDLTKKQLFKSGMVVGKDIIGTMTNTLILAFTGGFFITLFLYYSYNVNAAQYININNLTIEIAQSLSGSIALIFCMPLTGFIASRYLKIK